MAKTVDIDKLKKFLNKRKTELEKNLISQEDLDDEEGDTESEEDYTNNAIAEGQIELIDEILKKL